MMRALAVLIALVALAACDSRPREGADGYRFGEPEFERTEFTARIVQYDSRAEFEAAAFALGIAQPDRLGAFGTLHPTEPRCTVHVMHIPSNYQPEWLGHEIAHCMFGRWHK